MSDSVPLRQLQQAFGDPLFLAAQALASAGAVSELRVLQAGVVVTGLVSGESPSTQRHRVYIRRAAPLSESDLVVPLDRPGGSAAPARAGLHVARRPEAGRRSTENSSGTADSGR